MITCYNKVYISYNALSYVSMTQVISQEENQKSKQERKIQKALLISKTKRVRHSEIDRNFWFVQSGNPKTPKVWYCVQWSEFLQAFVCDCADFTYSALPGDTCVHILTAAFKEGGE